MHFSPRSPITRPREAANLDSAPPTAFPRRELQGFGCFLLVLLSPKRRYWLLKVSLLPYTLHRVYTKLDFGLSEGRGWLQRSGTHCPQTFHHTHLLHYQSVKTAEEPQPLSLSIFLSFCTSCYFNQDFKTLANCFLFTCVTHALLCLLLNFHIGSMFI